MADNSIDQLTTLRLEIQTGFKSVDVRLGTLDQNMQAGLEAANQNMRAGFEARTCAPDLLRSANNCAR
jgi:hypothetical protein